MGGERRAGPIDCVVFDWGGVILRICRTFDEGCAAAGLPVRSGVLDQEYANSRREVSLVHQRGEMRSEDFFRYASDRTGGLYSPVEIERIHHAWLIAEYPGVGELVDELNSLRGVTTGLLSNTNPAHWMRRLPDPSGKLPHFPTITRLEHAHASHLLGLAKPDRAIYRAFDAAFEARTGRAPSVLFFDDLRENVEAAREAGWASEQIDHEGDTAGQMRRWLAAHGVMG